MDSLLLARLQFTATTVYHFFFVPLTLGLSVLIAVIHTIYVRTGRAVYKDMAKFWGKLFLINFALGVVTGLVQEFQFGMNWSEFSRFVGDIFGVPLAIEALLAFFMESVFLGVWIFGWDRLPKRVHLASIWLVALGSNLSSLWILIANSFMQEPMGYAIVNGRAEMTRFWDLLANPNVWVQFPHVVFSGLATAGFFMLGILAYHMLREKQPYSEFIKRSFAVAVIAAVAGSVLVGLNGHTQAQHMVAAQPMKMAAAEALWESEDPAGLSLLTIGNEPERRDVFAIRIPGALSFLSYNRFSGEVKGIKELEAEYVEMFGPGDYAPPVAVSYWTFRIMVGVGMLMVGISAFLLVKLLRNKYQFKDFFLKALVWMIALPYIANTAGWLLTELGRQPWIVYGVQLTEDAVSPNVTGGMVLFSLIVFVVIYGVLMAADFYLLYKYGRVLPGAADEPAPEPVL